MAEEGSYDWWRANYATDPRYSAVRMALSARGVDCRETEVDHFPPNAAYADTVYEGAVSYGARPAFPLPKYLHRYHAGGGGMGGHVSTTGSTFVSKGWTPQLRQQMFGRNYYGAMRQDVVDKKNVAYMACLDRDLFDPILRPAVYLALRLGLITHEECYEIVYNLLNEA